MGDYFEFAYGKVIKNQILSSEEIFFSPCLTAIIVKGLHPDWIFLNSG